MAQRNLWWQLIPNSSTTENIRSLNQTSLTFKKAFWILESFNILLYVNVYASSKCDKSRRTLSCFIENRYIKDNTPEIIFSFLIKFHLVVCFSVDGVYVVVTVFKNAGLEIFSVVIGWIYFVAWSVSFYPQIYINWKRQRWDIKNTYIYYTYIFLKVSHFSTICKKHEWFYWEFTITFLISALLVSISIS